MTPHPLDYISRDQIQDLWGLGYTVVKRDCGRLDSFELPNGMVPAGRAYQWWHLIEDKAVFQHSGWAPVPASRHDGWFMPFGHVGQIEVSGLGLFEKPKHEVDQERASNVASAKKLVDDWAAKAAGHGLAGAFTVGGEETAVGVVQSTPTKTINTTVGIPVDMFPHMNEVFAERDRLYAELEVAWQADHGLTDWQDDVMARYYQARLADGDLLKGPTLNALLLPYAVDNVRAKLKEGKTDE